MLARDVVIIGTGGLGRETRWSFVGSPDFVVRGFVTNESAEHGNEVCKQPVLGDEHWLVEHPEVEAVCAIGDPRARRALVATLSDLGVHFASAIHPSVEHSEFVALGSGCVIGARAVLTTQVSIGAHVVIGVGAIVSHDCVLEDFVTLAPGVVLAGGVHLELGAELGASATVIPGQRVGRGALVGAQAAVVTEVPPNVVCAGVPARVLSEFPAGQRL